MLLLGESNSNIEFLPRPTLDDNMQEETDIVNFEDVTDRILKQGEVEIILI